MLVIEKFNELIDILSHEENAEINPFERVSTHFFFQIDRMLDCLTNKGEYSFQDFVHSVLDGNEISKGSVKFSAILIDAYRHTSRNFIQNRETISSFCFASSMFRLDIILGRVKIEQSDADAYLVGQSGFVQRYGFGMRIKQ